MFESLWKRAAPEPAMPAPPPATATPRHPMTVTHEALAFAAAAPAGSARAKAFMELFPAPVPPPGVPEHAKMAMDDALNDIYGFCSQGTFGEGLGFPGFAYLAELSQRPEYRTMSETIAKELTRKWIRITCAASDGKADKLAKLEDAMRRFKVQESFQRAAMQDGLFGRGQIFLDTGVTDDPGELQVPLLVNSGKIPKGALKALRVIEPVWVYPNAYNTNDPLHTDYFRPATWFVQGRLVHRTRLMMFSSRELPDILKPSYAFAGLSLSQVAKPYVDNWLRTRQSVSDLLHSFSILILATNMGGTLNAGAAQMMNARAQYAIAMRDNRGLQMIDKGTEELSNIAVPLGTLDALQAQAQEQMASVSGIPLVKLLGISPAGLNASSDGEIRVFYDRMHSLQEQMFRPNLKHVMDVIQLSEFGEIDPDFDFDFIPLWQLDDAALAAVQKTRADTHDVYVTMGALSPEEVRQAVAMDDDSPYDGLDLDGPAPGPPSFGETGDPSDPESNRIDEESEEASGASSGV